VSLALVWIKIKRQLETIKLCIINTHSVVEYSNLKKQKNKNSLAVNSAAPKKAVVKKM